MDYIINETQINPDRELLYYCCHNSDMYFFAKKYDLMANISILNRAIEFGNLDICQDILEHIAPDTETLNIAFENNHTDIIIMLLKMTETDNISYPKEIISYPIMNNNLEIVKTLENYHAIKWNHELYFSAILSGNLDMIKYIETKFINIHSNFQLDSINYSTKKMNTIINEITYHIMGKKYYSHTMNYAIQSDNIEIVKYFYELGYGITMSNFVTAIKQSKINILKFLCKHYDKKLPYYIIHYFGPQSVVENKIHKAKILYDYGHLILSLDIIPTAAGLNSESLHLSYFGGKKIISEIIYDSDYFMGHYNFFNIKKKSDSIFVVMTRLILEFNLDCSLLEYQDENIDTEKSNLITSAAYIYGNLFQIKTLINKNIIQTTPSDRILSQLFSTNQIGKLCIIHHMLGFGLESYSTIYKINLMLSNKLINNLAKKIIGDFEIDNKSEYIIESKNINSISEFLKSNKVDLTKKQLKNVLLLDDINLTKLLKYPPNILEELINWSLSNDLLEVYKYFCSLN